MLSTAQKAAKIAKRVQSQHNPELERIFAEDGFPAWLEHVTTEWEEAPGRTEIAKYPKFEFLAKYRAVYQHSPYSVCDKSRGMLASTDPLLWDFWNCQRVAYQNTRHNAGLAPWRGAVQRQSARDSQELLKRAYDVYKRLPDWVRQPLDRDNLDEMGTANGGIVRAFHAGAVAGRGDAWDHINLDEFAYQQRARENWQAFDRVRLKQATSTPNGRGNLFEELVHGVIPGVVHVRLHYTEHPDRQPGDGDKGDAWIARKKAGKSVTEWLIEYECDYDVYTTKGYFTADWTTAVVSPVDWDGKAIITLGTDYAYDNAGAVWSMVDEHDRWCRLGEQLRHRVRIREFYADLFEELRDRYPDHRLRIAPDWARGRQHGSDGNTDIEECRKIAKEVYGRDIQVSIGRIENMRRPRAHDIQRSLFVLRDDGKYGTVIDPSCVLLIQGFSGAYGPRENATPHQINDLEEPDHERKQVHVVHADGYGVCEYLKRVGRAEYRDAKDGPRVVMTPETRNWNTRFGRKDARPDFEDGRFTH